MASLQYSNQLNDISHSILRRSDRKKTKKIIKDDFTRPNLFKDISKKHKSLRLPNNLDIQIKKIQFLTQRTLSMLNYGKRQFSIEMLNEMRQAVNQQQNKLSQFVPIKTLQQKNHLQTRRYMIPSKNQRSINEKENTSKILQNLNIFAAQQDKEALGISTAQQLYFNYQQSKMNDDNDKISAFDQESAYCILQIPRCRKQSSKLLSDNYQVNELFYTIDHMIPNWHKDQEMLHQQQGYMQ